MQSIRKISRDRSMSISISGGKNLLKDKVSLEKSQTETLATTATAINVESERQSAEGDDGQSVVGINAEGEYGRRASFVQPTWQHIRPGEIPVRTLDKINGIDGEGADIQQIVAAANLRRSSLHPQKINEYLSDSKLAPSVRRYSSGNLGKLTRKGSLVVHRDSLAHTAGGGSVASASTSSNSKLTPTNPLIVVEDGRPSTSGAAAAVATSINITSATTTTSSSAAAAALNKLHNKSLKTKSTMQTMQTMIQRCTSSSSYSSEEELQYDLLVKVIMLGDSGVGKTSMLIMFRDGIYMPGYYVTTVGIDFMNKVVVVDGTRVKLQIWDTAGQERFRSVTHAYYRDAHALLLLYDVTNKSTYDNIRAWLCEIRDCAQEDVAILLIGNKADCSNSERQVKREDGERLAREHNVPFMETSAKTGLNVELAFQTVARQLRSRGYKNGDNGRFNVHEFVRDNTKAKSMCAQCNF